MRWFVRINNRNVGPMQENDVRMLAARGDINQATMVWREGMTNWVPYGVSGLAPGAAQPHAAPVGSMHPPQSVSPTRLWECYGNAFKNYATVVGRATRREYWFFALGNCIVLFCAGVVAGALGIEVDGLAAIYNLAALIPGIAVGVRRAHDVGKSGWFLLIPIYNLVLLLSAGTAGPNAYGNNPRQLPVHPQPEQFQRAA
jgi:uncharacterized membrane protein YhaH (DUF805 family)